MIEQAKDLGVWCLARAARFFLGWYWTPGQKATLREAEEVAIKAYHAHSRSI